MPSIRIKKLDIDDSIQVQALLKWENDPDLQRLVAPNRNRIEEVETTTPESLRQRFKEHPEWTANTYIIFDDAKAVGTLSFQMDPNHLLKKIKGTSWLSLTIGDKDYWGTGVAKQAMKFFEKKSIKQGACRVELGTFEFNLRAQKFYSKLGYVEFGRLKDFTYRDGRFWDDIRMEKILS